ncbi:MAG: hypothetical protein ACYTF1_14345 [Planctomycetota bacterium]
MAGGNLKPDLIAVQLIERVRDLSAFMESQDVQDQRKALFAFCKWIVADADKREIVVETDLTGSAQGTTLTGLPTGLCNWTLPEGEAYLIAQPVMPIINPELRFLAA